MVLEPEQEDLLAKFVEAHRTIPKEDRGEFLGVRSQGPDLFLHISNKASFHGSIPDAEILAHYGLLRRSYNRQGDPTFYVMPQALVHYAERKASSPAVDAVQENLLSYLDGPEFQSRHPIAHQKWEQAVTRLWEEDSAQQLTTIGHLCREVMQEFVTSLAARHQVDLSDLPVDKTVKRLQRIVDKKRDGKRAAELALLDASIVYWGTLSDLVQRQEHGAQKENEPLTWEDGRRVVFQTCVVMHEISRSLR